MWVFRFGLSRQTVAEAKAELERDELKEIMGDIAESLRGIDESLARLAEDSYKDRLGRT